MQNYTHTHLQSLKQLVFFYSLKCGILIFFFSMLFFGSFLFQIHFSMQKDRILRLPLLSKKALSELRELTLRKFSYFFPPPKRKKKDPRNWKNLIKKKRDRTKRIEWTSTSWFCFLNKHRLQLWAVLLQAFHIN